ncbi:uncharacterized protein [Acropora muricata]|uniref:uncharacterized protein n=1 Tax=Acropora muricata TaxID=159855 RepID=UPI0034E4583F
MAFALIIALIYSVFLRHEFQALASKEVYVSRLYGKDFQTCGTKAKPCRTLARGIETAEQNDLVLVDGSNTTSDPYNCENMDTTAKSTHQKTTIVNHSLQITSYNSCAHISCAQHLRFDGSISKKCKMRIRISGIIFINTSLVFIDSSASFVNCTFAQSINPIKMKFISRQKSALLVEGSLFSRNVGCIRLDVSRSIMQLSTNLNDVRFQENIPFSELEGSGVSIYSTAVKNCRSILNSTFRCENAVFRNNTGPLISNNVCFSESNEYYEKVTFSNNRLSVGKKATLGKSLYLSRVRYAVVVFNKLTSAENVNIRCIKLISSNAVQLKVLNSRISSHNVSADQSGAGILVVAGNSVNLEIEESSFRRNAAKGSGGVVSIQTSNSLTKVRVLVFRSNFTNNSAQDGGVFSISDYQGVVAVDVENAAFQSYGSRDTGESIAAGNSVNLQIEESFFSRNSARNGGGVVSIQTSNWFTKLQVFRSNFTNNSAQDGGAFFSNRSQGVVAVHVENATFQRCRSRKTGGSISLFSSKEIHFGARHTTWKSCSAEEGSSVYVSVFSASHNDGRQSNTTVSIMNCKFIKNTAGYGDFSLVSTAGSIDVFKTEWNECAQGFVIMECACNVNFTDVNVTECKGGLVLVSCSSIQTKKNQSVEFYFQRCSFQANDENDIYIYSQNAFSHLQLTSIKFEGKTINQGLPVGYHALYFKGNDQLGSRITLTSVRVENFIGASSIFLEFNGTNNSVVINNCTFSNVKSCRSNTFNPTTTASPLSTTASPLSTTASPLSIITPDDIRSTNISLYLSYDYQNFIFINNSSFRNNIGRMSGSVFVDNGCVIIRNSLFENNFSINRGGHIHVADGSASVKIHKSRFKQSLEENTFSGETYVHDTSIYSESTGSLLLHSTIVTTDLEKDSYRLLSVSKASFVKFDNLTEVQCAVGSALQIDNFSTRFVWSTDNKSKRHDPKIKICVITMSCHQCSMVMYSLERGKVTSFNSQGNSSLSFFSCELCPDGANCSSNIHAKPNYWGYVDSSNRGRLTFVHCPRNYCTPPAGIKKEKNLSVYNGCYGNRDGIMCGKCRKGFTETLFSTRCKPNEKCKNRWSLVLLGVYVVTMALFFIHQPPIVQILIRNMLWFKKPAPLHIMEYQPFDQRKGNSGYTKILFYFYQIASYLTLEPLHVATRKAVFVTFFMGLFNFQTRLPKGNLVCPFSGITIVTKELIPAVVVIAILITIQVIFLLHWCFNRWIGKRRPLTTQYYGATLKTLLLGYASLANTSLRLLTCVPVLGESRLYYDGNVKCLTWWQHLFIIFIVAFILPLIVVIYWGAIKLQEKFISTDHFIAACLCPLVFVMFWLVRKFFFPEDRPLLMSNRESKKRERVLKLLHDPFRRPRYLQSGSLYWESVLIGRRFLVLSFQVLFPDPLLRLFCMEITCLLIFAWHMAIKPFRDLKANIIEGVSLFSLVVIAAINLLQALFLSSGWTPQGHIERKLFILQQIEFVLVGLVPLCLALLCVFAVVSQAVRLVVLLYRLLIYIFQKLLTCLFLRRSTLLGQYERLN